jgi:hypothetical protein
MAPQVQRTMMLVRLRDVRGSLADAVVWHCILSQCRQQLEQCFPRLQAALAEHKQLDQQRKSRESATAAADAEQQVRACHKCVYLCTVLPPTPTCMDAFPVHSAAPYPYVHGRISCYTSILPAVSALQQLLCCHLRNISSSFFSLHSKRSWLELCVSACFFHCCLPVFAASAGCQAQPIQQQHLRCILQLAVALLCLPCLCLCCCMGLHMCCSERW